MVVRGTNYEGARFYKAGGRREKPTQPTDCGTTTDPQETIREPPNTAM